MLHKITNIPLCISGKLEKNPCSISVGGRAPHDITLHHRALQTQHKFALKIKALLQNYGTKIQTLNTCGATVAVCNSVFHFFTHSATRILPILHFRFNLPLLIVLRVCVLFLKRMVEEISKTITQYEKRLGLVWFCF